MSTATVFELKFPFEYRGAQYDRFTARRPKVRDLRNFFKNMERDAASAMEKVLGDLMEVDEKVIAEIDVADFIPMKTWFEDFLAPTPSESDEY